MEILIYPSDPSYPEINRVAEWIARLKNAHLFWDLRDMPELERLVAIHDLEELMEQLAR